MLSSRVLWSPSSSAWMALAHLQWGTPAASMMVLATALSMQTALPSTPQPTVRDAGQFKQALDGAILAVFAVHDGSADVDVDQLGLAVLQQPDAVVGAVRG